MRDSRFSNAPASQPRFGTGPFRGTVIGGGAGNILDEAAVTDPIVRISPVAGIRPVNVTSFSAPNRLRLGTLRILNEWWRFRHQMSGEFFVSQNHAQATTHYSRQMRPQHVLGKVVPNRRTVYEAPQYGDNGSMLDGQTVASRRRIRR